MYFLRRIKNSTHLKSLSILYSGYSYEDFYIGIDLFAGYLYSRAIQLRNFNFENLEFVHACFPGQATLVTNS